ncbi:MAG TPA: hypothetical protein VGU26_09045 [Gaiellaceae bacterium]|nr:hypothetical protein [Gaiellaceae bacterium]
MEELAARAMLVTAPDVGEGITTSISRAEIEEVLASEGEPIQLVLDVSRFSDGESRESRNIAVSWERSDLERVLEEAAGQDVILTFDPEALKQAVESDVEAHGIRETALALAVAATAATGMAVKAAAEPGPYLGAGTPVTQVSGPDDRAVSRAAPTPAPQLASDDRAVSRATPTPAPSVAPDDRAVPRATPTQAPGIAPDDRAMPRATPVEAPAPALSPDDRAMPRTTPVEAPGLAPDDRAVPRATPIEAPGLAPDDRAVPRATPVQAPTPGVSPDDRAVPRATTPIASPATGTVSDPGISWAPTPGETVVLAGGIALAIAGAFFLVGGRRVRPRPV